MSSDWKQLIGTVITGLIFSFLVAKLISIVNAFKDHTQGSNFRDSDPVRIRLADSPGDLTELASRVGDDNPVTEEKGSFWGADKTAALLHGGDGGDDWEEVVSTELDDEFRGSASLGSGSGSGQPQMGQVEKSWVLI